MPKGARKSRAGHLVKGDIVRALGNWWVVVNVRPTVYASQEVCIELKNMTSLNEIRLYAHKAQRVRVHPPIPR